MLIDGFCIDRMMHDKKIIGVCGETSIANAKQSIVTMAQVSDVCIRRKA